MIEGKVKRCTGGEKNEGTTSGEELKGAKVRKISGRVDGLDLMRSGEMQM